MEVGCWGSRYEVHRRHKPHLQTLVRSREGADGDGKLHRRLCTTSVVYTTAET
jgi:hypothetical protein